MSNRNMWKLTDQFNLRWPNGNKLFAISAPTKFLKKSNVISSDAALLSYKLELKLKRVPKLI